MRFKTMLGRHATGVLYLKVLGLGRRSGNTEGSQVSLFKFLAKQSSGCNSSEAKMRCKGIYFQQVKLAENM